MGNLPSKRSKREKRPNGSGSIGQRSDGALDVRLTLPSGKRRRKTVQCIDGESSADHRKRAEVVLDWMRAEAQSGQIQTSGHLTVSRYFEIWIAREQSKTDVGRGRAPATLEFYRQQFRYYVNPHLGSKPLPEVTPADVDRMIDALFRDGRSPRTVQAARNALSMLLKAARREGLISRVATEQVDPIRSRVSESNPTEKALEPSQVGSLLEAARGTRWEPLIATLALLGLRRGEALALRWSDIDLDRAEVRIAHSLSRLPMGGRSQLVIGPTKTASSRRLIAIPPVLVNLLRSWRMAQTEERLRFGSHWGGDWREEHLVFTTPMGTPVDPDNLRHALERLGRQAGIGHVHPHQLRHSVASVLIAQGHSAPEVARMLGHSNPSVTMTFYAHAFEEAMVRAGSAMADSVTKALG
jgi:integrase